jgi:3-phenylpropionate/cinnamic acid dioxygenase small subunit
VTDPAASSGTGADEKPTVTPELQHQVEQWYYREARLLDGRRYQTWLALVALDVRYVMPGRGNPMVDNAERGHEDMISVDRELEGIDSDGLPMRDERHVHLAMRVDRATKPNAWAENPPARTRRIVGNVEIMRVAGDELGVVSAFHMHYARPGGRTFFYAGQRRDTLRRIGDDHQLAERVIVMDMAEVEVPTLGLIL